MYVYFSPNYSKQTTVLVFFKYVCHKILFKGSGLFKFEGNFADL